MLGLLWIDPNKPYVTSVESKLPPNRPLHVYSYGTPSCMQEELGTICRSFVTSVVNHYDIIPRLSIGILTDLRNCADELLDEKNHGLAEEIFSRSLATFNKNNSGKELNWFWEKFRLFKKNMNSEKLVPPGVVYIIETADIPKSSKYFSRAPSTLQNKNNENMKRVILLRCDDVKEQFSELAFAKCMFFDHAPVNYENLLNALEKAIFKNEVVPTTH
ncbi:hypothetical protein PIROE2DRAFT_41990 [Piromyces sp. E2]|nr:hypothetical protein PIROE2DRAFT_41990 [Piromyces sp. E2]|eukprot:OUM65114.1 hypothetical protein PIROE2DRAFT_41990 [Piromyces sp. E2]